jgi:hypothetical protein
MISYYENYLKNTLYQLLYELNKKQNEIHQLNNSIQTKEDTYKGIIEHLQKTNLLLLQHIIEQKMNK